MEDVGTEDAREVLDFQPHNSDENTTSPSYPIIPVLFRCSLACAPKECTSKHQTFPAAQLGDIPKAEMSSPKQMSATTCRGGRHIALSWGAIRWSTVSGGVSWEM